MSKAPSNRRKVCLSVCGRTHDAAIAQADREDRSTSAVYERAVRLYVLKAARKAKAKQKATR